MPRLVALELPGGAPFAEAVAAAWARGEAVAVIPHDLPPAGRDAWLAAVRPHAIRSEGGLADHEPAAPEVDEGDALVVTTSGTTGAPKVLVHTHAGLAAHARAVHARLAVDPAADRWLACLPLHHLGGFGVVARALIEGVALDVLPRFDAATVARAPVELGTTLTSLVATALDRLDPTPFRWIVLGGSADPVPRPANVVHTYGLTETGGGIAYEGRALDGVELRIDADGAVAVRSPTLARGRRAPDGTVTAITDGDGWFATGDRGHLDDGHLVVEGRLDELIVTGGENVWPEPVEAALRAHPAVADVLVLGEPDPEWGQRVVAVVVPTDPAAPPALAELRAHVRTVLPAPAAPQEVRFVDGLQRTALGKLLRRR